MPVIHFYKSLSTNFFNELKVISKIINCFQVGFEIEFGYGFLRILLGQTRKSFRPIADSALLL